jgi:hypothetical protein
MGSDEIQIVAGEPKLSPGEYRKKRKGATLGVARLIVFADQSYCYRDGGDVPRKPGEAELRGFMNPDGDTQFVRIGPEPKPWLGDNTRTLAERHHIAADPGATSPPPRLE